MPGGATVLSSHKGQLLRILGVAFAVAVTIGGMIGTGILRTPGVIAAHTGSVWLMLTVWLAGGLYAAAAAANLSELASSIPRTGGYYVYVRQAFGNTAGAVSGWTDWLNQTAGAAGIAVAGAEYINAIHPVHVPFTAASIITFFGVLQWQGTQMSSRVQKIACAVQTMVFLGLAGAAFAFVQPASAPRTLSSGGGLLGIALALRSIVFAYDGWAGAIYFSEESREPKALRRAMVTGVATVTAVYLAVVASFLYVLGLPALAASEFPAADAAGAVFGVHAAIAIQVLSLLATPAAINVSMLSGTRILYAGARDKLFWQGATHVRPNGTPSAGLLVTAAATALFAATGSFSTLVAWMVVFALLNYCACFAAVFKLRLRPWGYPWSTGTLLAIGLALLITLVYAS